LDGQLFQYPIKGCNPPFHEFVAHIGGIKWISSEVTIIDLAPINDTPPEAYLQYIKNYLSTKEILSSNNWSQITYAISAIHTKFEQKQFSLYKNEPSTIDILKCAELVPESL
jgi:hypothetical protein